MALSNILREPRREITETAIGVAVVGIPIALDYVFGVAVSDDKHPVWLGMLLGAVLLALAFLATAGVLIVVLGIHEVGEGICNTLQKRNIHLRPRVRK